jgi:transposase
LLLQRRLVNLQVIFRKVAVFRYFLEAILEEGMPATEGRKQQYKPLGRALSLRATLQDRYEASGTEGPELLQRWCQWATRSRLAPFRKLAQTFRQYWQGIVSYFQCRFPLADFRH